MGRAVGRVVLDPERELIEHDLVFATARSALEAIAAGAATIVMDGRGLAGMATLANAGRFRQRNYGYRVLQEKVTVESVAAEIARYDPAEAAALSASLRPLIDATPQLDEFEALYRYVIEKFCQAPTGTSEFVAALGPLPHRWMPRYPGTDWLWQFERAGLLARIAELDATLARDREDAMRQLDTRTAHTVTRRLDPPFIRKAGMAWELPLFRPVACRAGTS